MGGISIWVLSCGGKHTALTLSHSLRLCGVPDARKVAFLPQTGVGVAASSTTEESQVLRRLVQTKQTILCMSFSFFH